MLFSQVNYITSPEVIGSSGGSFSNLNYNLSFTIGEISTETLQASNVILTQGFHKITLIFQLLVKICLQTMLKFTQTQQMINYL